jgi:hypothetical protein
MVLAHGGTLGAALELLVPVAAVLAVVIGSTLRRPDAASGVEESPAEPPPAHEPPGAAAQPSDGAPDDT